MTTSSSSEPGNAHRDSRSAMTRAPKRDEQRLAQHLATLSTFVLRHEPRSASRVHPLDSEYVELFWLPTIGPTAVAVGRRFALWLSVTPSLEVDMIELSMMVGLSRSTERTSPIVRTLVRLARFGRIGVDNDVVRASCTWEDVGRRQVERFPRTLAALHEGWTA